MLKAKRGGVQPVAVKVLRQPSNAEEAGIRRLDDADFAREVSLLRACRDANILQFVVRGWAAAVEASRLAGWLGGWSALVSHATCTLPQTRTL